MAQTVKSLQSERPDFNPCVRKIPGEGNGNPLHYSCLGNSTDRGAWRANSPWGRKVLGTTKKLALPLFFFSTPIMELSGKESTCQCRRHRKFELDPLGHEDSLEKEMATHSSILAWEIPWREEHGGLQSMGLQSS